MNKNINKAIKTLKRHAPTILSIIGSVGVVATAVATAKAVPKATARIKKAEKDKGEPLTKFETVVAAAPAYISAAGFGVGTVACIFGANALNVKQQAMLASAYAMADRSYKEYRMRAQELYGAKCDKAIREEIAKDNIPEDTEKEDGMHLFYDEHSKRYFRRTYKDVADAEMEMIRMFMTNEMVSLNTFYTLLKLPEVDYGDEIGWSMEGGGQWYGYSVIDFVNEKVTTDDGLELYMIVTTPPDSGFLSYYDEEQIQYYNEMMSNWRHAMAKPDKEDILYE